MKEDPVEKKLRELAWRRGLTEAEKAELHRWLTTHPETQADWEVEAELSAVLGRLPDVPVPSNFTARVLQAVERGVAKPERADGSRPTWWWRVFVPRAAVVALVVGAGLLAFQRHQLVHREKMAQSLMAVAGAEPFANPAVFQDFDTIRRITPTTTAPDKELLALLQ